MTTFFKEVWDTSTSQEADNSFLMVRQTQHRKQWLTEEQCMMTFINIKVFS